MQVLPPALAPLGRYRQFIVYRLDPEGPKTHKRPIDPSSGAVHSAMDEAIWTDFDTASARAAALGASHGVGFVFTDNDPFYFLDIDDAWDGQKWSDAAIEACREFSGAAVEVSQSRRGLHIIGSANVGSHSSDNQALHAQFYTSRRFVALTGLQARGDASASGLNPVQYVAKYFPPRVAAQASEWRTEPVPEWRGPTDDDELIRRAKRAKSAGVFVGKASFAELWAGDPDVLSRYYPSDRQDFDRSTADSALCAHLSFWTGRNHERMAALFARSGLYRDKWERADYRERTILGACAANSGVCKDKEVVAPSVPEDGDIPPLVRNEESTGFCSIDAQLKLFEGCVYVIQDDAVLMPSGDLLNPSRFKNVFGRLQFALDDANSKFGKDAWEAFVGATAYKRPMVDAVGFDPRRKPRGIYSKDDRTYVNAWVPPTVRRVKGDPTPFLQHIAKILPDRVDQQILLSYMAACVQYPGIKFKWAPLLVGVEGNGKSMVFALLAEAVGRRYAYVTQGKRLANHFNAWVERKLLVVVEDLYDPSGRDELMEELKPLIAPGGNTIEIEGKGKDQRSAEICANFCFTSNHLTAIRKHKNERRICVMLTAQAHEHQLANCGMDEGYFVWLNEWLWERDGVAIMSDYLATMPIPDQFNPATSCVRAPKSSREDEVIAANRGPREQLVLDAIEVADVGFAGGWVSSKALTRLFQVAGRALSSHEMSKIMEDLGYVVHPVLRNGRTDNAVQPDDARVKLWCRRADVRLLTLQTPADVAKSYSAAQASR